ncbi:NAD(P)-dependent oxidoreductase [Micromonospora sp. WMMA1996]|uniref:NmrA family NAD(P)-binding protein n=1 Tax=Micromonospora sp. WMMA1996 TaxID=2039878 RepID=UPI000BF80C41|nr:NAD(P)H-binding protein [Micromonospora sp. WMMA1996]PGH45876.1 NAD(P)-dependent oxidoreductase [Micromonospora sp. WMMA1996]
MIVITGATGHLGSRIVAEVLRRVPAAAVGVSVTDVAKASALQARGVRVRRGDFTDPATLADAFEGADQVLIVSAAIRGAAATGANIAAIDAATAAGAQRVLYTSHQGASTDSLFPPMITHARTEEHLAATGIPHVALRNGFYSSTLRYHLDEAQATGRLALPADGPVSWTGHDDLAAAAAVLLTDDSVVAGPTAPLTAPSTLDFAAVAAVASEVTGREVARVVVDDEEWVRAAVSRGMPRAAAEFNLGMFRAARRGEFMVTDPTLETLIGRPAESVRTALRRMLAARP